MQYRQYNYTDTKMVKRCGGISNSCIDREKNSVHQVMKRETEGQEKQEISMACISKLKERDNTIQSCSLFA